MSDNDIPDEDGAGSQVPRRRRGEWMLWLAFAVGAAVLVAVAFILAPTASPGESPGPAISAAEANLLEVNPLVTLGTPAPDFTLTDQHGTPVSLASFRGKAVVLTFGDDKCTDLCTLLAQDVLAADTDLAGSAHDVQFISINANAFYPSVAATSEWTTQHGLANTPNWRFLTGSPTQLARIAKTYGVDVELDSSTKTIVHGADMFFIDPSGHEVQIGQFGVESANTALYAHAMAQLASDILPSDQRHRVGGPTSSAAGTASTALGSTAPPVELPRIGSKAPLTTASYHGKYVVLNFWSATCALCVTELPALQKANEAHDTHSVILGIDVSDRAALASPLIRRAGTTYPMLADSLGAIAGQFRVPGFPYTVILDPTGTVVVRHPGAITTEQLEYLLQTLETESGDG